MTGARGGEMRRNDHAWGTAPDHGDWVWVSPPGWPTPPAGFVPPPGWRPDPAWPPAPPGHRFWRPAPTAARTRLRLLVAAAIVVPVAVVVVVLAGLVVAGAFGPFDPAPGDTYTLTVRNNTAAAAEVFGCLTDDCTRGYDPATLTPGEGEELFTENMYEPSDVGVANPRTHALRGCLTPPSTTSIDRPLPSSVVDVTRLHPCPGVPAGGHPVVRFDSHPGG